MIPLRIALLWLLTLGGALAGDIQSDPPGSPERKPILDALRATEPIQQLGSDWQSPIVFTHVTIRRSKDWAWVQAAPATPNGRRNMEPLNSVMHKTHGAWTLVDFVSDEVASADDPDVAFRKWQKEFLEAHSKCPSEIFPAHF